MIDGGSTASDPRVSLAGVAAGWISLWCAPVDWDLFDRIHAEDFQDCSPAGRDASKTAFAAALAALVEAFPDLQTRIDDLVLDSVASRVAIRWSATGTNRRRFLDVGPTVRRTEITGIEIIEVRDGRVTRRWGEWDIGDHTGR
jgi:steroid delta-isomerase-like uncharacterized protein